ncbi:cytidylate kinase family protein [Saccharopolyspora sp. 6M]|uniref:cytidylate kinase family protein n=1 Tax=Saccharopolyspora sp. 6M TaxID=2877237 RepID=UPI001CD2142C|nr:cytidylate kinase family protein [Saccharopolyspora sp. 6M]MCA1229395.1 cytidylate kinase family protein [Saccharopolyspora sp. 6M]
MSLSCNIAFAGLTAAGKTTHAKLLAQDLDYDYVSATDILLQILGIEEPGDQVWFSKLKEINQYRKDGGIDDALERRILHEHGLRSRTIMDTWALAWIGADPLVRVWIESDLPSRARKCLVSQQHQRQLDLAECRDLVKAKDEFNRDAFLRRHRFDLFTDRSRYDIVLRNTHLIPTATKHDAQAGVKAFAPVVRDAVIAVMTGNADAARKLTSDHPNEVLRITVSD